MIEMLTREQLKAVLYYVYRPDLQRRYSKLMAARGEMWQ